MTVILLSHGAAEFNGFVLYKVPESFDQIDTEPCRAIPGILVTENWSYLSSAQLSENLARSEA